MNTDDKAVASYGILIQIYETKHIRTSNRILLVQDPCGLSWDEIKHAYETIIFL